MSLINAILSLFKKPAPAPAKKPFDISHLKPDPKPSQEVDFEPIKYEPVKVEHPVQTHFIAANMRLSENGARLIRADEGVRLTAYKDTADIWTIGYGHTGPEVREGMVITKAQAEEIFRKDAQKHCEPINRLVRVPLTQNEYDALSSLIFNIGAGGFAGSTLLKRLNAGDRKGAADQFLQWKNAVNAKTGKREPILLPRRQRERALFLTPPGVSHA